MTDTPYEVVAGGWVFIYESPRMQAYQGRRPRTEADPKPDVTYMWEQKGTSWVGVRQ